MRWIIALDAIARNYVIVRGVWRQEVDVIDVELAVRVHEHDKVTRRRVEPTCNGCPVAPVDRVVHQANVWVLALKLLNDFEGAVLRPVIDHDNLVIRKRRWEHLRGFLHNSPDVWLLVVGGEYEGN